MKYIRTETDVFDLEKEIETLKNQAVHNINEKCDYMYDDFYNEEGLTPKQIEEKRKNNINSLIVEKGTDEDGFYIFIDCKDMDECCVGENYGKIVKQSDNLEELCDEFVLVNLEYFGQVNPKHYDTLYELKTKNSFEQEGGISLAIKGGWYAIYGAIWTKEGLIYVTKLNEKGELEVL